MAANATCNVCVSPYNKTARKVVTCSHCAFSGCRDCQKRYILGTVNQPHCMSCKIPWESEFIIANFTKKFFNEDLAAHRGNAIFESEKALMPGTQEELRRRNAAEEIRAMKKMVEFYTTVVRKPAEAKVYGEKLAKIREANPDVAEDVPRVASAAAPKPVCGCIRDDCRGFVMNNTWKCGLCDMSVCQDCLKEKVDNSHECKDEDKETRKLLLKNTKPCPKCAVMISKVDGCSQMWCTMCHTTFDWNSGEIVTNGYTHNPHYFEWARRNGHNIPRAPGDEPAVNIPRVIQCGDVLPEAHVFTNAIRNCYGYSGVSHGDLILNIYRLRNHINEVVRRDVRNHDVEVIYNNLRMKYLSGELPENIYKEELVKTERKAEKITAEWNIAELYITQATETLIDIYNRRPKDVYRTHLAVIQELADYCNQSFKQVSRAYGCTTYFAINHNTGYLHRSR